MAPIPYCGLPPPPGGVTWNLDPLLIAVLLAIGAPMLWRQRDPRARTLFVLGWAALVLLLISPLCNLSVALFSARVGQHLLLILVAAPLVALGVVPPDGRRVPAPGLPAVAFALALWAWHLPGPYVATFGSDAIYWLMQASLFGTAYWLWAVLRRAVETRPDLAALCALATAVQMGLLGALLTLAPRPLFGAVHGEEVTGRWGLSALEDQQLGGLMMWVPGGLVFAALCVLGLGLALRRARA
jgi:putative membrane protein